LRPVAFRLCAAATGGGPVALSCQGIEHPWPGDRLCRRRHRCPGQERLREDRAVGCAQAKHFHVGSFAETKQQKIVYDDQSGWLAYAKKGSETADPVYFAKIGKGLDLDHTDIMVI
jgi:hypothetical protein